MKTKKTGKINSYLLDTSAVLCLWLDESGSNIVENILRKNKDKVELLTLPYKPKKSKPR